MTETITTIYFIGFWLASLALAFHTKGFTKRQRARILIFGSLFWPYYIFVAVVVEYTKRRNKKGKGAKRVIDQ